MLSGTAARQSRWVRRLSVMVSMVSVAALVMAGCTSSATTSTTSTAAPQTPQSSAIATIVQKAMATYQLPAVIVRVTQGNKVLSTQAFGSSQDGVPATVDMHFRNGAVAFAYVSTLLMEYVDQHKVTLDETIDHWLPSLPESNQVTLRMLTNQTTGYPDFETDPAWQAAYINDPFRISPYQERLNYAFDRPMQFAPGTNWSYSHTNFMILGQILSMIGKAPLATLLQRNVLGPMGLTQTAASTTSYIPSPVLHSYDSERRTALGIPSPTPFYEESTYWNPAWGTPDGAAETTTIFDLATTAVAVGTGKLLSVSSYHAMTDSKLIGFGQNQATCGGSCFTQVNGYNYGLGIVRSGPWILQNPLLSGYSATEAYLPSQKISISVAVTYSPGAFDCDGNYANSSDTLFRLIGAYVAPTNAPPVSPNTKPATGCH
ncbi:MAG TPA: serine hydrolase domain-containing protein [Acidimicrobiales bacterium]|nr:serine hydrolase domain-containing protein [Acidimicrobiales bacterium]